MHSCILTRILTTLLFLIAHKDTIKSDITKLRDLCKNAENGLIYINEGGVR